MLVIYSWQIKNMSNFKKFRLKSKIFHDLGAWGLPKQYLLQTLSMHMHDCKLHAELQEVDIRVS